MTDLLVVVKVKSVKSIGDFAFLNCGILKSVSIGNGVTSIGDSAFLGCNGLTDVHVNWAIPLSVDSSIFQDIPDLSKRNLHVPIGTQHLYAAAPVWKEFNIIPNKTISGTVMREDLTPLDTGHVLLYKIVQDGQYPCIDTVPISNGTYLFTGVDSGDYVVLAKPDSLENASPTYFGNTAFWDSAKIVRLENNIGVDTIDIVIIPLLSDTAKGNTLIEGEVVYEGSNAPPPPKGEGVGLDKSEQGVWKPFAQTFTDANGTFAFSNLPDGTYRVRLNIPGLQRDTILPPAGGADTIFSVKFTIPQPVGIPSFTKKEEQKIKVYPNPTNGKLIIECRDVINHVSTDIEIYDVVGCLVRTWRAEFLQSEMVIDISHLAKGLYFLKVNGKVFKVVKQ